MLDIVSSVKLFLSDSAQSLFSHKSPLTDARNSMTGATTGAQQLTHVANPVNSMLQDRGMQIGVQNEKAQQILPPQHTEAADWMIRDVSFPQ